MLIFKLPYLNLNTKKYANKSCAYNLIIFSFINNTLKLLNKCLKNKSKIKQKNF